MKSEIIRPVRRWQQQGAGEAGSNARVNSRVCYSPGTAFVFRSLFRAAGQDGLGKPGDHCLDGLAGHGTDVPGADVTGTAPVSDGRRQVSSEE